MGNCATRNRAGTTDDVIMNRIIQLSWTRKLNRDSREEPTVSRLATLLLLPLLLLVQAPPCLAEVPTQRDWLENLVDGLGWSFGLPDEPEDADYLSMLDGDRLLHIEAEDTVQPEDLVSIKTYTSFGPYTGTGWVNGIPRATQARLKFLLQSSGRYQLSTSLRLPGHQFEIGGQTFQGDGTENFTRVVLGDIELTAGEQELLVTLPQRCYRLPRTEGPLLCPHSTPAGMGARQAPDY